MKTTIKQKAAVTILTALLFVAAPPAWPADKPAAPTAPTRDQVERPARPRGLAPRAEPRATPGPSLALIEPADRSARRDASAPDPNLARGVLEEELNFNLDAAIVAYRASIAEFEARRLGAAQALFRLAECYRKQSRLAEADAHYTRIVREFSDYTDWADLSQKRLAAGPGAVRGRPPVAVDAPNLPARPGEAWEERATPPLRARNGHTAVWTGREYIVFGGQGPGVAYDDGASYDPAKDSWTALRPEPNSRYGRTQHTALWTGNEMILWGGYGGRSDSEAVAYDSGARWNPSAHTWRSVSRNGAPTPRFDHTAVWTGKEMILWGGYSDVRAAEAGGAVPAHLNDGARYDPAADAWRSISTRGAPSPRYNHSAVWTGTHMIVWGGGNSTDGLNDGAMYDPADDYWSPLPSQGAPQGRLFHTAVWTGSEMIIYGGRLRDMSGNAGDAARFNPATGQWQTIPQAGARSCAIWTGTDLITWGGELAPSTMQFLNAGARFDPAGNAWFPMTTANAPAPRALDSRSAVWTGDGLLFFGGWNGAFHNDTWRYRPPTPRQGGASTARYGTDSLSR